MTGTIADEARKLQQEKREKIRIRHTNDNVVEMDQVKENQIIDLLNESESYFEGNLNAAANNLSMLTMHTFEFAHHLEQQRQEQVAQEKIVRNIEAHAQFISQKSADMRARLEKAAQKYGYRAK